MKREESKQLKEEFLKKRVLEGKSFDTISRELGVSKNTLLKWSKELKEEIETLENSEKERLIEQYKVSSLARLEAMLELREKILQEIKNRDLEKIPLTYLLKALFDIEALLDDNLSVYYYTGEPGSFLDMNELPKETITFKNSLKVRRR